MFKADQKIVLITRETRLAGLKARYATKSQAAFHLKRSVQAEEARSVAAAGGAVDLNRLSEVADVAFRGYEEEDELYGDAVHRLRGELANLGPKVQVVDRSFIANFLFGPNDIVVTVGQDGLVANAAKYALQLPIVAVNPDPKRIDGVLLPFKVEGARPAVQRVLEGKAKFRAVTMAEAILPDGQRLLAFNDFFVGAESHVSARYRIKVGGRAEPQSSSGVLISTGAGSTGWLSSVFNMAAGLAQIAEGSTRIAGKPTVPRATPALQLQWEDPRLAFVVREPFVSRHSSASIVAGVIEPRQELILESLMPSGGVIFSDGIEVDFLQFNSGTVARIRAAAERAKLVIP